MCIRDRQADTFAIDTYQITDDGKAEAIDDTFTIKKTGADAADIVS